MFVQKLILFGYVYHISIKYIVNICAYIIIYKLSFTDTVLEYLIVLCELIRSRKSFFVIVEINY